MLLGFPVLRLRGDYLAIVTLAFGEIIRLVLLNWQSRHRRPERHLRHPAAELLRPAVHRQRRRASPRPSGSNISPTHRVVFLFYLILALALLTNWVTLRLRRLPIGRAWEALREDEIACRSLGINTTTTKLTAFAIGAMFGGFAGSFFATRQGFISPEASRFSESALMLAIVVLGGMGSQLGVALAALVDDRRLRAVPRVPALPHAGVRLRHGADHDLAAARPGLDARAVAASSSDRKASPAHARRATDDAAASCAVEHLTMRFGGLVAVDDLSFDGAARRHHRADRAERRRQDHRVQLHHRLLQADRRA